MNTGQKLKKIKEVIAIIEKYDLDVYIWISTHYIKGKSKASRIFKEIQGIIENPIVEKDHHHENHITGNDLWYKSLYFDKEEEVEVTLFADIIKKSKQV